MVVQLCQGKLTTLDTFTNDANGGYPSCTPMIDNAGVIRGTAPCNTTGGTLISTYGCGVICSVTP